MLTEYIESRIKFLKPVGISLIIFLISSLFNFSSLQASSEGNQGESKKVDVAALMIHHVTDTHDWHFLDIPGGDGHYTSVAIHLPWILYNTQTGLEYYGNTEDLLSTGKYVVSHEHVIPVKGIAIPDSLQASFPAESLVHADGGHGHSDAGVFEKDGTTTVLDFSITKTVLQIMIVGLMLILVFTSVAKSYRTRTGQAPKGLQSLLEPVILFVRDDIAKPNLQGKHDKFLPYLLTLFFFIWFSNILGLTPLNSNIAGNVSVSVALAILTFLITTLNASKSYWGHIFWFPGVPLPVKFLMLPVEIVGMFTKPFALTVRLFANIAAGHLMVLALIGLIFILGEGGTNVAGGLGIAPLTIAFGLFIFCLEVLVAAVQAYVFTLLTAVFIGQAMEDHSHDHAEGAHAHH